MSLVPCAHLLIVLYVAGATMMASGISDLGEPGLLYWLRTGLPVSVSMAAWSKNSRAAGVAMT